LYLPTILSRKAFCPIAVLWRPIVFKHKALFPIAVL